jgi:hypothetical protein
MLRNRLFKRFAKNGIEEPVDKISNAGLDPIQQYPTLEELTSKMKPITPSMMGKGIPKTEEQYETNSGELSINAKSFESKAIDPIEEKGPFGNRMFENMFNQEQTLRAGEEQTSTPSSVKKAQDISNEVASQYDPQKQFKFPNLGIDPGDAITLGLYGVDAALTYNQDLENQRKFNESIQQRNSKPVYDYNFMYGRTTSGGTEYQPTIKAEMGAKINKRYASEGMNDVEIEGGEFIQLPNLDTEMAEGPSHSNGGIPTNLPDETRVYSNNLKPEGSKKTFAQIAKNYDTTSYKKTLENPFAKQVDKDTASLMMQRNQKILDDLFRDQQILNGNSNGEVEAKNGASINNAGFKALPQSVQDKILAEMKYGGFAQREAQSLEMADGGKKNPQPDISSLPPEIRSYAKWDPTFKKEDGTLGVYRLEVPSNLDFDAKTNIARAAETYGIKNLVQTSNQRITGSPNVKGFYAGLSPQDFEQKIVRERLGKEEAGKLNELDTRKKAFEILGVDPGSYDINDPTKLYNDDYFRESVFYPKFKKYLPESQFRAQKGDDKAFGFEHLDAKPIPPEKPLTPEGSSGTPPEGTKINDVTPAKTGKYTPGQFPLYQAIPEAMGLAQSQEIYPYAIPEIDAPYVRPQTLNIQSELQDIDNMGTAAIRSGADPNMAYIAGLDAKQKAFQSKQNYDAQSRSQADMANAQMSMQADQFNAQAFDRVYNNLVGQARDAQSAEKQAAVSSLVNKKAKFVQDENLKAMGVPLVAPGFNVTSEGKITLPEDARAMFEFYNYMKDQESKTASNTTAKKGMYKK